MPVHNSFICLQRCCRTALEKLYPAGVPPTAMWRYHREMRLLERAKKSVIDEFLLFIRFHFFGFRLFLLRQINLRKSKFLLILCCLLFLLCFWNFWLQM